MRDQLLIACKACHRQFDVTGMNKGEHVRCVCGELVTVPQAVAHHARMVHCSSCGGKLESQTSQCQYCGSETTLEDRNLGTACPECFARLRMGAQFCSECGVKISPSTLKAVRASSKCPRCKGPLVVRELPEGHYTECTSCGGIWLDSAGFDRVVTKKDEASHASIVPKAASASAPTTPTDQVKYVPCPTCGNLMNRKNFAGCSGVIIDWCKGHGFWFDTHELEKVIQFIREGGMDKARQLEIQRSKAEIDRLRERRKTTAGSGVGWDYPSPAQPDITLPDVGEAFSAFTTLLRRIFT